MEERIKITIAGAIFIFGFGIGILNSAAQGKINAQTAQAEKVIKTKQTKLNNITKIVNKQLAEAENPNDNNNYKLLNSQEEIKKQADKMIHIIYEYDNTDDYMNRVNKAKKISTQRVYRDPALFPTKKPQESISCEIYSINTSVGLENKNVVPIFATVYLGNKVSGSLSGTPTFAVSLLYDTKTKKFVDVHTEGKLNTEPQQDDND